MNRVKKLDEYVLEIKNGFPPNRGRREYRTKLPDGALLAAADRIKPGQYVENLSAGSEGKFAERVHARGLKTVRRREQGRSRGTVYVVTEQWLVDDPDV